MRLNVWSPLPPSPSGIADYVAEMLPLLARRFRVTAVVEEAAAVRPDASRPFDLRSAEDAPDADLDLYQIGNSPSHAFAYRAALRRPGVVVLHEWSLHHLVLHETVERGLVSAYLLEMRRAHGEAGTFVGRQVARDLGGDLLPSFYPLNDRLLEGSLGVVGLTEYVRARAARRLPGRPVLHLPHHLSLPFAKPPSRAEARSRLGLPQDALVVTAPGLASVNKGLEDLLHAASALKSRHPRLLVVVAGGADPRLPLDERAAALGLTDRVRFTGRLSLDDFVRHLCAADVVSCLRFPTHGEISGALLRALGLGRPVLVTAGTPAGDEFPEGVVVPVDPGACQAAELEAVLDRLLEDEPLRERISGLARVFVAEKHDLQRTVDELGAFLVAVADRKPALLRALSADREEEGTLAGYLMGEVLWGARDVGLLAAPLGIRPLVQDLLKPPTPGLTA